jgi:MFS family permease
MTPAAALGQQRWMIVAAAFCGVMVGFGSLLVFTFSVFVKPLSAEFGWSREVISGAFGFAAMSVAVASPVLGRLLDRYGPVRVILPCMAVYAFAFASLSQLAPSIWQLYATFVVLGIVGNGTTQMGYSRAVSTWFYENRGLALALVIAGTGVGGVVLPPLAQSLITNYGWRAAYAALGVLVIIVGTPLTAVFVRERTHAESGTIPMRRGMRVAEGLRSRAFWIIVATLFLGSITINGAITHLSALLTDRGISSGQAAAALSILGAFSFCGRIVTGHLLDRYFGPRVSFVLMLGVAAGIATLARASSVIGAFAAAALIGFGLGAEADITPYLLTRYFGLRSFSTLYGFTWTAYAIAGAIGPVIMGKAFDVTGSYGPLLSLLAIGMFVSAGLNLLLPRYPVEL